MAEAEPESLSLTSDGTSVYWSNAYQVRRVSRCDGGVEIVAPKEDGWAIDLVHDDANVYWLANEKAVRAVSLTGGAPRTLATSPMPMPGGALAIDAAYVYYASVAGLARVPKSGGASEIVTAHMPKWAIAVDATRVYFGGDQVSGLMAVDKSGGTPLELVPRSGAAIGHIAVDDTYAYFTTTNFDPSNPRNDWVVGRVAKAGGPLLVLAQLEAPITALRIDAKYVYWANEDDRIRRVLTSGGGLDTIRTAKLGGDMIVTPDEILWTSFVDGGVYGIAKPKW